MDIKTAFLTGTGARVVQKWVISIVAAIAMLGASIAPAQANHGPQTYEETQAYNAFIWDCFILAITDPVQRDEVCGTGDIANFESFLNSSGLNLKQEQWPCGKGRHPHKGVCEDDHVTTPPTEECDVGYHYHSGVGCELDHDELQ